MTLIQLEKAVNSLTTFVCLSVWQISTQIYLEIALIQLEKL